MSALTQDELSFLGEIRAQFPALSQTVNGNSAVFLDAPGGTQVPRSVLDGITQYLIHSNSNLHGAFVTSWRSDETVRDAHAAMADFLNCAPDEVIFGANMTTLTFAVSRALGREIKPGDEILTTVLDHDANVAPWRALAERGAVIQAVDIHPETCTLDLDDFHRKLNSRTRIVAVGHASNAVGTINPVEKIVAAAHAQGALVFVDAVHFAPHRVIDVRKLNCDFLACSTYKFFGPHAGVVFGRREHLERLQPYKVRPASEELPGRWETGTQNHEGMAGVTACVNYLAQLGRRTSGENVPRRAAIESAYKWIESHEAVVGERLINGLLDIPQVTFYGLKSPPGPYRTPTVCIRLQHRSPEEVAASLGHAGFFTWNGNFYALGLSQRLGVEDSGGFLRIGLAHYNTSNEVDSLLDHLRKLAGSA